MAFTTGILYFFIYSFLGWCCETVYCSVPARRWVRRGFLFGPVYLLYGFGAILILTLVAPFSHSLAIVFLGGIAVTTTAEYLFAWGADRFFGGRDWDYSGRKLQLHGRICLKNSLLFGCLAVAQVYLLHPVISALVTAIPAKTQGMAAIAIVTVMLMDAVVSAGIRQKVLTNEGKE